MAWKLVQIADADASQADLSDAELLSVYLLLRDRMKSPYDDTNPQFTAYLKMGESCTIAAQHTRASQTNVSSASGSGPQRIE
jgi:hypothetical protein